MCGRFVSKAEAALERLWELKRAPNPFEGFNVSPGMEVPVVRRAADGGREPTVMRWGLIPFWAHGAPLKFGTFNARCERMQTAPAYRGPWRRGQRCLIPAAGFYEWQAVAGRKTKQPWFIRVRDEEIFALGGLWDSSTGEDGVTVESCTIVTMPANALLAEVNNTDKRMPLIVPRETFDAWLGEDPAAEGVVQPFPDARLEAWPVSTYVNNPRHDDPRCCARDTSDTSR